MGVRGRLSYGIAFMWNLKMRANELTYKTETDSGNKLMFIRGERWWRGINQEGGGHGSQMGRTPRKGGKETGVGQGTRLPVAHEHAVSCNLEIGFMTVNQTHTQKI